MATLHLISTFSIFLICCSYSIIAQQPYIKKATTLCRSRSNSTSVLGYTYNGVNPTCQAYLTFRCQPPYNDVSSISSLLASDPLKLSQKNSVPVNATFEINKVVIVPVNCFHSGQHYQVNSIYVVNHDETYFSIANNTFQGLSTCQALMVQNSQIGKNLFVGTKLTVPLRCACPTKNQSDSSVNYLMSYLVTWGQSVSVISHKFRVHTETTLAANNLSTSDFIFSFTTLLIPLQKPPSNSQVAEPPPPPLSLSQSPKPAPYAGSSKTRVYVIVGVVGGFCLLLGIGVVVFCCFFQKQKKKDDDRVVVSDPSKLSNAYKKPTGEKLADKSDEFLSSLSSIAQSLNVYTFKELQFATADFSTSSWIKGSVYLGKINDNLAAIKKMNGDVTQEIDFLNKINHLNLIRLSGFCFNDGDWYLVYECAVNGTLSDWIYHSENNQKFLNWKQRIQIALDVATGINYLHNYTTPPYVHKDLKCSNVLLNSDYRAKISNFSLARSVGEKEGEFTLTNLIVGTKGYMAPEYLENGLVSPKLDVYAFGILMLEILTGNEVADLRKGLNKQHLSELLLPLLCEEDVREQLNQFMDPGLE